MVGPAKADGAGESRGNGQDSGKEADVVAALLRRFCRQCELRICPLLMVQLWN
jgi:hypothetical protein